MSYHSSPHWSVNDKDWQSNCSRSVAPTPVSSWGTLPDSSSGHSVPRSIAFSYTSGGYPSSSLDSPHSNYSVASIERLSSPLHPGLQPQTALSLKLDLLYTSFPPKLPFNPRESAFNPPVTRVNLEFEGLHPNWKVCLKLPSAILVCHVLEQIYRHCYSEIRREQDQEVPHQLRAQAAAYFQKRASRNPGQANPAMMLIDVMGPRTLFTGLTPKPNDPTTWVVRFGPSPFSR
ncbi:hypothetical protein CC2G_014359 [Coprinopsis cinerea AmutBmut pab1-1]|nr:hypothetical protein CC2G_014359 [Coprinopsis cinerea AmutBmut pab1-1]